jgi:hypothetical protein
MSQLRKSSRTPSQIFFYNNSLRDVSVRLESLPLSPLSILGFHLPLGALRRPVFLQVRSTAPGGQHVTDGQRARVSDAEQRRLLDAFLAAAQSGDVAELERLFAQNVVSQADGGGLIRAAQKPIVGRERVAKYIAAVSEWGWSGVTVSVIQANQRACALLSRAGVVAMLVTIEASPEGIDRIMWVMRPSKLTGVGASSSLHPSANATDLETTP